LSKKSYLGAFAVVVAAGLWGASGVIFIPRLGNLSPSFVVFMMHFLPSVLLTVFCHRQFKMMSQFSFSDWVLLLLISVFGAILGTLAIVKALFLVNFHHLSVVVLLQKVQPIFTVFLAGILLKEKVTKFFIVLSIIILTGGYFLTFGFHLPTYSNTTQTLYAALLAVFAAFCFGSSTVFSKMIATRHNSFTVSFYRYLLTAVILGGWLGATGGLSLFRSVTSVNWLIFILIIFTSGFLSIYLYYIGIKNIKAGIATFCELSMPISAVVLDYFVNHSYLSVVQVLGGIVMICGIVVLVKLQVK
jgi:drug/metabolite transporter (DMT)-like permease